jgi:hypothetical protein
MNNWPLLKKIILYSVCVFIFFLAIYAVVQLMNINKSTLTVQSDLAPTTIFINDKKIGESPLTTKLSSGVFKITAISGNKKQERQVGLSKREQSIIFINFNETAGPQKEQRSLVLQKLAAEELNFVIEVSQSYGYDLKITLNATFNSGVNGPPAEVQQAKYESDLKIFKKEALDYIRAHGSNPDELKIEWTPAEADNLN